MAPKRFNEQKAECEQSKKTKLDSNVSGEGNPSSSTPTEGSDMMNVSGDQTESSIDEDYIVEEPETEESGYQTETATETESSDNIIVYTYQTEIATETESLDNMIVSGEDSKSGNQTEGSDKMSVSGEESKPGDSSGESEKENMLIEKHLTRRDVEDNLFFRFDLVSKFFPPPPVGRIPNAQLLLSSETVDDNDRFVKKHWDVTLTYSCADSEFVISTGWQKFVSDNMLEARDFIQFYLPDPRTHDKHYDIEVVRSHELDLKENFVFELQLKPHDISSERLVLGMGHVRILLPEINTTLELRFTDSQKKDWCMKTKFDYKRDGYLVTNGWKEFLNERNLDTMHKIKLCKPALPLRKYHFLISHEKTENDGGSGTDPFQSGDDDGGSSSNIGSN